MSKESVKIRANLILKPIEERRAKLELEGGFGIAATCSSLNPIAACMAEQIWVWAVSGEEGMSADGPWLKNVKMFTSVKVC